MQAFLSIYGFADWIIRSASLAALTLVVGGVTYRLFTLTALTPSTPELLNLTRLCRRILFWAASALCLAQLLAAGTLTTFLMGSSGAPLTTALSADASILGLVSAAAAFALACMARRSSYQNVTLMFVLTALLVGAHTGVTHAASRGEPSPALLAAETLHLFSLGAWIGGIPYFIVSLRALGGFDQRLCVSRRFSIVSLISVAVLIATGVYMSVPYVGSFERLYQTTYGLLLDEKVTLLAVLLCLGAANFFAIRMLRRGESAAFQNVPVLAEAEVGVSIIAILCAAALASSPLGADTTAARPTASEILSRFEPVSPRLGIPTLPTSVDLAAPSAPANTVATESPPPRTSLDIAWSEAHHHYAALFVILTGMVALVSQLGHIRPLARHWPVLFLSLAVYLFIVADDEAWPLGKTGFFVSLATPRIAQHKIMIALVAGLALFEWRVQSKKTRSALTSFAFPLTIAGASAFLLTHYGHTGSKEEVLTEISHMPVAMLGVIVATARWLELRLPTSELKKVAAVVWPIALISAGVFLLLYRETA